MHSVNNRESTGRLPCPLLTLFLVVVDVIAAFVLPGLWLARNPLMLEVVGAFASITVFLIYTSIYGSVRLVLQHRGLLTVLMLAGPWLFAAVNVWGKIVPSELTTPAALTGLLTALAIGVTEELLFRGILFRAFQGKSMALYVLVSSITFGVLHYQQGFQGVMVTAVVGSSYALARVGGAPLTLLIVCHAATDFPGLFSHTPHPQYYLVASVALALALALAIIFFVRRTDFTIQGREVLPSQ